MKYNEKHMDLFTVRGDWYYAHCIASDLRMGAGIAVPMQKKFGLRDKIKNSGEELKHPTCVLVGRVFNLITKKKSSGKPSEASIRSSLVMMRDKAVEASVERLAMPKIGCGLDRLSWPVVKGMIQEIFADTDIEILVCNWK